MDKRKQLRIKSIELDFGMPFVDVLKSFAEEHSYSFTMQALGLNHHTYKEYKSLFTPRRVPKLTRPHVTQRNLARAPRYDGLTVTEWSEKLGLSKSCIRYRIKHGLPIVAKKLNGNVANFGAKYRNENWARDTHEICARIKSTYADRVKNN